MGGSGAFVAKNSNATSWHELLHLFGPFCTEFHKAKNDGSLGCNGVDRVRSLRKILMRLRGTKFCTSLDRFAPSFLKQPNRPKCTQMVRNSPKHEFRVNEVDRVLSLQKIPM